MRTLPKGALRVRGGGAKDIEKAGEGLAVLDSDPGIHQHEC
jgi:hypothetical protein